MRLLALSLLLVFSAFAADVTGKWSLSVDSGATHGDTEIDLKQEGAKLTGMYKGSGGESALRGSVKGDAIEFTVTVGKHKMLYQGTVNGNQMSGAMQIPGIDEGRWTATKK